MLRLLPALLLLRFLSLPCTSSAASYSNYSEAAAIRYVDLAGQAYCTPSQIRNATNQHAALISGFTPASVWHNDNLQFYAGYDALTDSVFVAVRGSLDLNNWIDNIDAVKTAPYEGAGDVEVHSGFWSEYEQLRDPIVAAVTEAADKYGTDRLSVAGHSSGGANSVFLAYDVARGALLPGFELLPLYTFGCPRVGNKAFYDAFEALDIEHTRVVHWRDIVPHLPNEWMGFRHTAREVWYSNEVRSSPAHSPAAR